MATQQMDPAVLEFGERFLEYLIAAEIVSRGTGPLKFSKDRDYQNTIIFDTFVLEEDQLPAILRDSDIVAAREIGLIHKDKRPADFEQRYANVRMKVWHRFKGLYDECYQSAVKIKDPLLRQIRLSELESVKANYDLAGFHLGFSKSTPSFANAQMIITGTYDMETPGSLETKAKILSEKLEAKGIQGKTLQEKIANLDSSVAYLPEDRVVPTYEELVYKFRKAAAQRLGISEEGIIITVKALPSTENKRGSFEYEGKGKAVTAIKPSPTTVFPRVVHTVAHEMTHLLESMIIELYFNRTRDMFAAAGTMCTAGTALNEGISMIGSLVYRDVVLNSLGKDAWMIDLIDEHETLKKDVVHYTCRLAYQRIYLEHKNPEEVRTELENIHLKYGMDKSTAAITANGIVDINRQHKNMFYSPFYGIDQRIVQAALVAHGNFEDNFRRYVEINLEKGPHTLMTMPRLD